MAQKVWYTEDIETKVGNNCALLYRDISGQFLKKVCKITNVPCGLDDVPCPLDKNGIVIIATSYRKRIDADY